MRGWWSKRGIESTMVFFSSPSQTMRITKRREGFETQRSNLCTTLSSHPMEGIPWIEETTEPGIVRAILPIGIVYHPSRKVLRFECEPIASKVPEIPSTHPVPCSPSSRRGRSIMASRQGKIQARLSTCNQHGAQAQPDQDA